MVNHERHEWLAQRVETAIDPERRIIDAHHHLWQRENSTYLAAELIADTRASHNVTHTVFVECSAGYDLAAAPHLAPIGEVRFVAEQAEVARQLGGTEIAAMVGHADMRLGDAVAEVLAAEVEAGAGLFRGVRHGTNWSPYSDVKNGHHEPVKHQLDDRPFREGLAALAEMGLSYDAWMYFDQLGELASVARAIPECNIILNHLGGPLGIGPHATERAEMTAIWQAGLTQVAQCPNVVLKVGGIGMEHYFGTPWAGLDVPPASDEVAAYWHDKVHFAIETFGPQRCMFESNFPVDRQTLPYTVLWNAFQILAARYDEIEQHDLFFNTAATAYRIPAV